MAKAYQLRTTRNESDFIHLVTLVLNTKNAHFPILLELNKHKAIKIWELARNIKHSRLTTQKGLDYMFKNGIIHITQIYPNRFHKDNLVYICSEEVKGFITALSEWYYRKEEENE